MNAATASGSSPHARGLPGLGHGPDGGDPDHPRTRGVYCACLLPPPRRPGSSPHARGLRAGTGYGPRERPDHPRTRGVYQRGPLDGMADWGSSPHARGLPHALRLDHDGPRIIPARAGFTTVSEVTNVSCSDHPRTRGVYGVTGRWRSRRRGSSPHARGLRAGHQLRAGQRRIIPARAGFTTSAPLTGVSGSDHPRTRGVYSRTAAPQEGAGGSSPHARGLHSDSGACGRRMGIIPARAGFTEVRDIGHAV